MWQGSTPGDCPPFPSFTKPYKQWKTKADIYAKYYLQLFISESFHDNLLHEWGDLQTWIFQLQHDNTFISKGRRMVMYNYIHERHKCLQQD